MAKTIHRLTHLLVKKTSKCGSHNDGGGLYLLVKPSGAKSWFYRYQVGDKQRKKGLGKYPTISLACARDAAQECRLLRRQGKDPIEYAKSQKLLRSTQETFERAINKTFEACAIEYIDSQKAEWTNAKHSYQWTQSLKQYVFPFFGDVAIQQINVAMVVEALRPIWTTKTETATRVRQRIEAILDYARALNYIKGDNPALWKGRLSMILPNPNKVRTVKHHPAMSYKEVSDFYLKIRMMDNNASLALAFIILTATRSGEARNARWDEIDFESNTWLIPTERMKSRRIFRVPLSSEALLVLQKSKSFETNGWVFPGLSGKKCISDTSVRNVLKKYHPELTVHGFRSTFRDWCAEMTSYPRNIAEASLAHVLENKTEAAYQRGDLLEKRGKLMNSWSQYLLIDKNSDNGTPIK